MPRRTRIRSTPSTRSSLIWSTLRTVLKSYKYPWTIWNLERSDSWRAIPSSWWQTLRTSPTEVVSSRRSICSLKSLSRIANSCILASSQSQALRITARGETRRSLSMTRCLQSSLSTWSEINWMSLSWRLAMSSMAKTILEAGTWPLWLTQMEPTKWFISSHSPRPTGTSPSVSTMTFTEWNLPTPCVSPPQTLVSRYRHCSHTWRTIPQRWPRTATSSPNMVETMAQLLPIREIPVRMSQLPVSKPWMRTQTTNATHPQARSWSPQTGQDNSHPQPTLERMCPPTAAAHVVKHKKPRVVEVTKILAPQSRVTRPRVESNTPTWTSEDSPPKTVIVRRESYRVKAMGSLGLIRVSSKQWRRQERTHRVAVRLRAWTTLAPMAQWWRLSWCQTLWWIQCRVRILHQERIWSWEWIKRQKI